MEKLFHLKERGTDVKTEVIAGITTFLTMAYILAITPNILGTVMDRSGVFVATAIASAISTFVMAILANYPIALSAGLGSSAYFAYTVCMRDLADVEDPFTVALTAIFVEGIIFILLSVFKAREALLNGIPQSLKIGITAGIGLFIALIGLNDAGIVISSRESSVLIGLGEVGSAPFMLTVVGFILILVLTHFKVKGAILIGIIATWVLGMIAEKGGWYVVDVEAGIKSVFPDFTMGLQLSGIHNTAFHFNFGWAASHILQFVSIVFALLYMDLFNTIGTVVGVADKAGFIDKDGKLPKAGRVLLADAIGTTVGACLGTSTVTSFVESSAGVAEGGKTGLTALTTGGMFLLALFFAPIFLAVPSFATAPALIYVGMIMLKSITKLKFDGDIADAAGAYLAAIMMPFAYSIATGIMFSVMAWALLKIFTGKFRDIKPVMWVIFGLFSLRIITIIAGLT